MTLLFGSGDKSFIPINLLICCQVARYAIELRTAELSFFLDTVNIGKTVVAFSLLAEMRDLYALICLNLSANKHPTKFAKSPGNKVFSTLTEITCIYKTIVPLVSTIPSEKSVISRN